MPLKNLISKFRKGLLVSYFVVNKQPFIFTDVPQGWDRISSTHCNCIKYNQHSRKMIPTNWLWSSQDRFYISKVQTLDLRFPITRILRNLTKANMEFTWSKELCYAFKNLISKLRKRLLVSYFDMNKYTVIFTDVHPG